MKQAYLTGYFALPAEYRGSDRVTKVHVVDRDNKLLCGRQVADSMIFQFCAAGIHREYVDCKLCLRKIDEIQEAADALPRRRNKSKGGFCSCCGQPLPK